MNSLVVPNYPGIDLSNRVAVRLTGEPHRAGTYSAGGGDPAPSGGDASSNRRLTSSSVGEHRARGGEIARGPGLGSRCSAVGHDLSHFRVGLLV